MVKPGSDPRSVGPVSHKPRIAVLISGQYRSFRDAWATNAPLVSSDEYDVDFYLDVWREVGATPKTHRAYRGTIGKSKFDPFVYNWSSSKIVSKSETLAVLPDAKIRIHDGLEQHFSASKTLSNLRETAPQSVRRMFENSVGMFYLIEQSYHHLLSLGRAYDWVIRIRPDWVLRRNIVADLLSSHQGQDAVFFDSTPELNAYSWGYVTDVCFAGTMSSMAMLSSTYRLWIGTLEQEGWVPYPEAHLNHFSFLVGESALSHHIRDWRKDKSVGIGAPHAGYLLREGRDVKANRKIAFLRDSTRS